MRDQVIEKGWRRMTGDRPVVIEGEPIEQQSDGQEKRAASQDLAPQPGIAGSAARSSTEREVGRDADDE